MLKCACADKIRSLSVYAINVAENESILAATRTRTLEVVNDPIYARIVKLFFIMGQVLGGRVTVTDGDRRLITIMNMSLHNSIYQLWKVRSARSLSS